MGGWGTGGVAEALADEAGQDWGDERGDVGLDEQVLIFEERVCELHHHIEDEHVFESVGDFLGDKLDEVGEELVEARVIAKGGKGGGTQRFVGFVSDGRAHAVEVELQFFGEDVFYERLDGDIVTGTGRRGGRGSEGGCRGAFGGGLGETGSFGLGGVLGDGGLDTLDGKPVGYPGVISTWFSGAEGDDLYR